MFMLIGLLHVSGDKVCEAVSVTGVGKPGKFLQDFCFCSGTVRNGEMYMD